MKITDAMVYMLNEELEYRGYPFTYKYDDIISKSNPCMRISLPRMRGVQSFNIVPTEEFFDWLEDWFKRYDIELSYNNDGSIIWSKNGWE